MSNPNIKTAATIQGLNASVLVGTTYAAAISNATTSNALNKISFVNICNITAATSCAVTLALSNGTTYYHLLAGQAVTASIQPVTRQSPVYLKEGDSICIYAATSGHLQAVFNYEQVQ
jgi:hypothetical protein